METEVKVFHSEISRVDCEEENHLYDLLKIEPAKPLAQRSPCPKNETWEFKPNYDKQYSPKRAQSQLKVKTVSSVRALFEKNVYVCLPSDLALQQNYLLRKICDGSSCEENTRNIAIRVLNNDNPISRASWQMLSNINPQRHNHSKQFVLSNGKCIQVNGSKGGKNKFICNHDLKNKVKKSFVNMTKFKNSALKPKLGLLRNSLSVKFKPGPLGKKKFLDVSHHKYHMGNIEVVKLPAPVLEVSPTYGTVLESTISSFVNSLRGMDGLIPQKLAEFAVSVLGTANNNTVTQLDANCSITFDMNYKCEQNRVLMRRNVVDTKSYTYIENDSDSKAYFQTKSLRTRSETNPNVNFRASFEGDNTGSINDESIFEIKQIMNEMLDSVDISLNQDSIYSKEDDPRGTIADDAKDLIASKDKCKRKFCELDKLDVTIINLPESSKTDYSKPCAKSFCTMGCVCESLDRVFNLKQHCGALSCMFGCKCEASKYKNIGLLEEDCCDIIPGLLNLDNEINSHLAKEEQKFHQTVIFSGQKRILLKSRKRICKSSKRYAEFYSKMNLNGDEMIKKILTVDIERLNCENIEPLCMVHNLYKCFCNGKFIETYVRNDTVVDTNKSLNTESTKSQLEMNTNKSESTIVDPDSRALNVLRPRLRKTYGRIDGIRKYSSNADDDDEECSVACARTMGYHGRKYSEDYYTTTNKKITEMEQNDRSLKKKMARLINRKNSSLSSQSSEKSSESLDGDLFANMSGENNYDNNKVMKITEENNKDVSNNKIENGNGEFTYPFANAEGKGSLKTWLESSYKSYKERLGKGIVKTLLEAPKKGKAALQSWDFILSRYRERKNIFVVTKQEPFRTFLAVNNEHPLFANCINIDDIRFADLPKYPIIIRNLVTNASDSENVFCILRGWDHCWELIGSAVKVIEQSTGSITEDMDFYEAGNLTTNDCSSENGDDDNFDQNNKRVAEKVQEAKTCYEIEQDVSSEKSKWFVLTVENDFTEIQFYKKGFFVTYEGIQRSITLARISGKTVRLSSRVRADKTQNTSQPYGIYAIPCTLECCVFIGPYEVDEPLGIEVVKTVLDSKRLKKTRGVWINTNKVDDKNVIENPLAYLPSASIQSETIPTVNTGTVESPKQTAENYVQGENLNKKIPDKGKSLVKQVKPIKIRRTNGFYHFSSKSMLQKISKSDLPKTKNLNKMLKIVDDSKEAKKNQSISNLVIPVNEIAPRKNDVVVITPSTSYIKPVAEIAPQIKITHVYSKCKLRDNFETSTKKKGAMLILKPDEINKKVAQDSALYDDIEKFLETSTICAVPQEEVLVISDCEDGAVTSFKDVWIQCCNIENFGYIRGKRNFALNDTRISFEFPGFKYSEFYKENEAFDKINQVLARKMYIPRNVKLQWEVIEQKQNLTCDMLTTQCLEDKKYLLIKLREQRDKSNILLKPFSSTAPKKITIETARTVPETTRRRLAKSLIKKKTARSMSNVDGVNTQTPQNKQMELIQGLEERSRKLENESAVLWNEAVNQRDKIFHSLSVPDSLKLEMTEALQDIMLLND